MMRRAVKSFASDSNGVVAPVVALSLFALLAVGGLAFDYARLATMDTELQDAADQAALAGASQLDGQKWAVNRAVAAAQSLLVNQTLLGNDRGGTAVKTGTTTTSGTKLTTRILFYTNKPDAEADTNGIPASAATDAGARFIKVDVVPRRAYYALTPLARIFWSDVGAAAVAGLGSAICKVPPLLMCNPDETVTNLGFNVANYAGKGLHLVQGGSTGGYWTPGNFGYLNPPSGSVEYGLGANSPPGNCYSTTSVKVQPGAQPSATAGINARFDIFENGLTNSCNGVACSPALNTRKDLVHPQITTPPPSNCGLNTGSDSWQLPDPLAGGVLYLPDATTGVQTSPYPTTMGLPRDICHAESTDGACKNGRIGDGVWDRNVYFYVNHRSLYNTATAGIPDGNWSTISSLTSFAAANGITLSGISRYDVYRWEIGSGNLGSKFDSMTTGKKATKYYSYASPQCKAGLAPTTAQPDRRLLNIAVANCSAQQINGNSTKDVTIVSWVEAFLVEPSIPRPRTTSADIYVEIQRETKVGANTTTAQAVRRDLPYLVN